MKAALKSEYRKLAQTRLWIILVGAMMVFVAFVAVSLAFVTTAAESDALVGPVDAAKTAYASVNGAGYVFPLAMGALIATTEFRNKTISTSLIANPSRSVLLLSKLVVGALMGLVFGVFGQAAAVVAAAPVLQWQGEGPQLGEGEVLLGLAMGVLATVLWSILGVAFGMAVRNQVVAIVAVLIFTQVVEPLARLGAALLDPLSKVGAFLPGAAVDAMLDASFLGDLVTSDLLPRWGGVLVMLGYTALFAVFASRISLRRDVV